MSGRSWCGAGVQQEKTPRSVSIFGFAHVKAGLPHQRCLLITESAANRNLGV